jgi:hypothetical protein
VRSTLVHFTWRGPATRVCAQFPVGSKPRVFVNPLDPSDAVLVPGGDRFAMPFAILMAGIMVYTGLMRIWGIH